MMGSGIRRAMRGVKWKRGYEIGNKEGGEVRGGFCVVLCFYYGFCVMFLYKLGLVHFFTSSSLLHG